LTQCEAACSELRVALSNLVGKIDFATLDSWTDAKGELALAPLRESLSMLRNLIHALFALLCHNVNESEPTLIQKCRGDFETDGFCHIVRSVESNRMEIKTCLVFLRACADKIPFEIFPAAAREAAAVISQGLMEQILSWASEAESCFETFREEALCQRRKQSSLQSSVQTQPALYSYSTKPSHLSSRRCDRREDLSRGVQGKGSPTVGAPFKTNVRKLREALVKCGLNRFQRHRPPRLIIPEGGSL
jgi:hypothetical protein